MARPYDVQEAKGFASCFDIDDFHICLARALEELRVRLSVKHEYVLRRAVDVAHDGASKEDSHHMPELPSTGVPVAHASTCLGQGTGAAESITTQPVAPPQVQKPAPPHTSPKSLPFETSSSADFLEEDKPSSGGRKLSKAQELFSAVLPMTANGSEPASPSSRSSMAAGRRSKPQLAGLTSDQSPRAAKSDTASSKPGSVLRTSVTPSAPARNSVRARVSFQDHATPPRKETRSSSGGTSGALFKASGLKKGKGAEQASNPIFPPGVVDGNDAGSGKKADNASDGEGSQGDGNSGNESGDANSDGGFASGSESMNSEPQDAKVSPCANIGFQVSTMRHGSAPAESQDMHRHDNKALSPERRHLSVPEQRWHRATNRISLISTTRALMKKTTWADQNQDAQGRFLQLAETMDLDNYGEDDDDEEEFERFYLCPVWVDIIEKGIPKQRNPARRDPSNARGTIWQTDANNSTNHVGNTQSKIDLGGHTRCVKCISCWASFVQHPSSLKSVVWQMLGIMLFCYDAVVIPLQFFDPPTSDFVDIMTWIVRVYWTVDIPCSFLIGDMMGHGQADLSPLRIAKRYMSTWFCFDLIIVALDWSELFGGFSEFAIARVGKLAKSVRMLRMFRAFKLMSTIHVPEQLKGLGYYFKSERLMIFLGIFRIIVFIIWTTHFIACFWYGLGRAESNDENALNWVDKHGYTRDGLGYLYTTSFHWSLTQFTGSMDIQPHNTAERTFAILSLLIAFIISAYAVSSITTSMTRLELVSTQMSAQNSALRNFLTANAVSKILAYRIQRSAKVKQLELKRNAPERDVELLSYVSEPLKVELHYELYAESFVHHPFFVLYDQVYTAATRQLCHSAVERHTLSKGDVLFSVGELPEVPVMYFVVIGRMMYFHENWKPKSCKEGTWACEAALWTPWACRGGLRAQTDCSLIKLNSLRFQRISCQFLSREANPINYGKQFLLQINQMPKCDLTDLADRRMDLHSMAENMLDETLLASFKAERSLDPRSVRVSVKEPSAMSNIYEATIGRIFDDKRDSLRSRPSDVAQVQRGSEQRLETHLRGSMDSMDVDDDLEGDVIEEVDEKAIADLDYPDLDSEP